jgi:hypothetical protein
MTAPNGKRYARVLLALDGATLGREVLTRVQRRCMTLCPRLDILLVNPPREATSCLGMLLLRLEHGGVDYRVASAHGEFGAEILRYLGRYRGIDALALAEAGQLSEQARAELAGKGHEVLYLDDT